MPTLETLTEDMLFAAADRHDHELASSYVKRVLDPARSGQRLSAQVQGKLLYDVQVSLTDRGILNSCTCTWGGNCKHVYALLLKWLQAPEAFATVSEVAGRERPLAVRPVEPPPSTRPEQLPAWLVTPFAERQQTLVERLARSLHGLRLQDLRAIARRRGWRLKGTDKDGIVLQVAVAMARADGNLQAALTLDDEQRRVLAALILMGDGAKMEAITGLAQAWGQLSQPRQFQSYADSLQALGLALPISVRDYGPHGHVCPDAVGRWLLPLVHDVLAQASPGLGQDLNPAEAAGEVRLADPFPFVRAASQLTLLMERSLVPLRPPLPRPIVEQQFPGLRGWDYDATEVQRAQQEHRLRRHGDLVLTVPPPKPSLPGEAIERLAPVAGDEARLEFTYALLVSAGVLQPGSPVTIWPEVKRQYLCRDELEQRAVLAHAYFSMVNWSELWALCQADGTRALAIKRHAGYAYYTQDRLRVDLAARRLFVLRALACLPEGRWIALPDFFQLLRPAWPRFDELALQQPNYYGPSTGWYLAQAGSDVRFMPESDEDWDLAQGSFVRQVLAGPLHWLGLADLHLQDGELAAFRLHGLASLFWDLAEATSAPPHTAGSTDTTPDAPAVTVEGQSIVVCPSAISSQAHGLLERIARLSTATYGRFAYELDVQATYQAFEAGLTLADILDAWQHLLPIAMPEGMRAQLANWWAAYGRVRIYQGLTVIEFADDYALPEMKAVTSLARHIVAEISPRLVVIEQGAADALIAELKRAGYTPKRMEQV